MVWVYYARDECHVTKIMLNVKVEGCVVGVRPKKRCVESVKDDMSRKGLTVKMTADRV